MVNLVSMRVYETYQMMHLLIQRKVKQWIKTQKNLHLWNAEMKSLVLKGATDRRSSHMKRMFVTCKNIYEMVIGLIYSMVNTKKKDKIHM